jgi:hypothetical protein
MGTWLDGIYCQGQQNPVDIYNYKSKFVDTTTSYENKQTD